MNKRSENNISTSRILKSKYLDKDKQQTLPLRGHQSTTSPNKKKIKLVDLCPEEKLKVGELIKTLDQRRMVNEGLTAELQRMRGEMERLKEQLQRTEEELQRVNEISLERQGKISLLKEQLQHLKEELKQQGKKNVELARTSEKYLLKLHQAQRQKHSIAVQTAPTPSTIHQETQVTLLSRETGIQTDKQDRERDLFYRPHSKSFEKIMKAPSGELPKTSIDYSQSFQSSKEKGHSPHHPNPSPSNDPLTEKCSPEEEQLDELDEKWARLKSKHQRGRVDWQNSPHSFHISEQTEKSSKRKGKGKTGVEGMDEEALNRMLRLKDFSASKLMRLGQGHGQSQERLSSDKAEERQSPEVNYLKSPYFNRVESDSNQNTRVLKTMKAAPQEINFYESGLFEGN